MYECEQKFEEDRNYNTRLEKLLKMKCAAECHDDVSDLLHVKGECEFFLEELLMTISLAEFRYNFSSCEIFRHKDKEIVTLQYFYILRDEARKLLDYIDRTAEYCVK